MYPSLMKPVLALPLLAVSCIVFSGCKSDTVKISNAEQAQKGTRVSTRDFTMDLPNGWKVFDLTQKDFKKAMEAAKAGDPKNERLYNTVTSLASSNMIKMCAFDMSTISSGFADNINVVALPGTPTITELRAQSVQQLTSVYSDVKDRGVIKTPNCEVVKITFNQKQAQPIGDLYCVSLSTLGAKQIFTITITVKKANEAKLPAIEKAILASFKAK